MTPEERRARVEAIREQERAAMRELVAHVAAGPCTTTSISTHRVLAPWGDKRGRVSFAVRALGIALRCGIVEREIVAHRAFWSLTPRGREVVGSWPASASDLEPASQ